MFGPKGTAGQRIVSEFGRQFVRRRGWMHLVPEQIFVLAGPRRRAERPPERRW